MARTYADGLRTAAGIVEEMSKVAYDGEGKRRSATWGQLYKAILAAAGGPTPAQQEGGQ